MEHGELGDRVEGLVTRPVNEDALVWDRCHHIVLDEFINETAGTPLVDVRRRDPGRIPVLGNEFGFESFVVVRRVVEDIRSCNENSRSGRASSAPHALRRRQTHWLERADSRMTDSSSLYINQQSPNSSGSVG